MERETQSKKNRRWQNQAMVEKLPEPMLVAEEDWNKSGGSVNPIDSEYFLSRFSHLAHPKGCESQA